MGAADLKWNAISLSREPPTGVRGHIILIANSDYKFFTKLDGPGRDINAAASAFAQIGFRTTVLTDPSKERDRPATNRPPSLTLFSLPAFAEPVARRDIADVPE